MVVHYTVNAQKNKEINFMLKKVKKAIFPVGGLGTRFLPATKSIPKEMLPVASKPLIQYAFEEAINAGIEQFIFVTGRNKSAINNHFDYSYELQDELSKKDKSVELELTRGWLPEPGKIIFMRQQKPLGLGHAILCAKDVVGDEPCAVILADEMLKCKDGFLKEMIEYYHEFGGNIIGVSEVAKEDVKKYGVIVPQYLGERILIKGMVEKPNPEEAPSNLSIVGRYILQPRIFEFLSHTRIGKNNEIQLTDAMAQMLKHQEFDALVFKGQRLDCGSQEGFLEANIVYSLDNKNIADGVTNILKKYGKS
jgi:UTP--glucose-1-phosphate uridylyltransferase